MEQYAAVSPTMSNTVYSSLAWSGATRLVSSFGVNDANDEVNTYLASLVNKITAPELMPTADNVIELLTTPPELEAPNTQALAALKAAGEDTSAITDTLAEEHNLAMARFTKQAARISLNEKEIRAKLEKAFKSTDLTFIKMPQGIEDILSAKLHEKLEKRRARLIVDISSGRFVTENGSELKKINNILSKKAA